MSRPILFEVIATDVADAKAAVAGGADRLELVRDMAADGLTPDLDTFAAIRASVDVPLRVMLRTEDSFSAGDLDALRRHAAELREAGADEFVIGFLTGDDEPDVAALRSLLEVLDGCRWTFHRAVDRVRDRAAARAALAGLPGLDTFLTAGSPHGVPDGLDALTAEASAYGDGAPGGASAPRLLVGGGLRLEHLPLLRSAGVDAFHVGTAVRDGGHWDAPVDADRVRTWRDALLAAAPTP